MRAIFNVIQEFQTFTEFIVVELTVTIVKFLRGGKYCSIEDSESDWKCLYDWRLIEIFHFPELYVFDLLRGFN